ncbi:MAG: cupredoxin domain-containing protein [Pseudonocardiaceae bacterium]
MTTPPAAVNRVRPITILLALVVAVLGLVTGCGGGAASSAGGGSGSAAAPSAPTSSNTIVIKDFSYTPASLTVAPGTKITVVNQDQAPHTVTANDKSFDSGTIEGGRRGEVTAPTKPGTYAYICTIHQYMTGTLIVK